MSWSIAEVARMAKVTSRTLRHYDEIGLLPAAWTDHGGQRHYRYPDLLRLQQILLLRDLGLGLAAIGEVLDQQKGLSTVAVLQRHREWLLKERSRLGHLVRTVEKTIDSIEKGKSMAAETMFEGFAAHPYEEEARKKYGDKAVDAAWQRIKGWSEDDAAKARNGYTTVHEGLAVLLAEGVPVEDQRVQDLIELHHEITSLFWTPTAEAYRGLGQTYVEDERFRQNIGGGNDALVDYLRDAMAVFAAARLS